MRKPVVLISVFLLFMGAAALEAQQSRVVDVVAAENFYGNIVSQIGGDAVNVTSVMSDPNVDPHEYESNVEDAKAIADAELVVENGAATTTGWTSFSPRLPTLPASC